MWTVLILLTSSIATEGYLVRPPAAEFGQAPAMPRLVRGLPSVRTLEREVCFPWRRYEAMEAWTRYAKAYPSKVCQRVIDHAFVGCRMWAENQTELLSSQHKQVVAKLKIEANKGWQLWEVAGFVTGAFLLGALGGYLTAEYVVP